MIAEKINISTMIMATRATVRFRPINFTSMAMEDAHTAEADSEKGLYRCRSGYVPPGTEADTLDDDEPDFD